MKLAALIILALTIYGASLENPSHPSKRLNLVYVNDTITLPTLSSQKSTAQTFINAYNAWDIEAIMGYRAPECVQQALPSSMGKPAKNNTEYRKYLEKIIPLFLNFTVTVHEEFHDAEARTSIIHASSRAITRIGSYSNEYALFLSFTGDGKKITKIDEFVDSAYSSQFFAKLKVPA
jgi:ketosteroid isomerase-like protein